MKTLLVLATTIFFALSAHAAYAEAQVTNRLILAKEPGRFMEVRHITVKGTNREIGQALGKIARQWLQVKLTPYNNPIFGQARRIYMQRNYPILLDRMKGVAEAYGISPLDTRLDTSSLNYSWGSLGCTAVFIPPRRNPKGRALVGRNMDARLPADPAKPVFIHNYVLALHPDQGYASLVFGSQDLLNGATGGMNSQGLAVMAVANNNYPGNLRPPAGGASAGLNGLQMLRLVLDTCATVGQAKRALLINKYFFSLEGLHLLVADRTGRSFIFEVNGESGEPRFINNRGATQILTNHSVSAFPKPSAFPPKAQAAQSDSFVRSRKLHRMLALRRHVGAAMLAQAMNQAVVAASQGAEGAARPQKVRTLWSVVFNLSELKAKVKFYLKDGPTDPKTGQPTLVFSQPMEFSLQNQ